MKGRLLLLSAFTALLAACNVSLAGDLIPPPEAVLSAQENAQLIEYPPLQPDFAHGEVIYADRCAACHGLSGQGDGEAAAGLPFAPAAIGSAELARANSPESWYALITQGRMARYMPPFGETLSIQERWDALAYVYSLSIDSATLERGAELYDQHSNEIESLFVERNPLAADLDLVAGLGLSAEDSLALTAYLQAQALGIQSPNIAEAAGENPTPEAGSDSASLGTFMGRVEYGSQGSLPSGLEAQLSGFDHTEQAVSLKTEIAPDGEFSFSAVPLAPDRIFFVQVAYQGQIYFSEFLTPDTEDTNFDLPIIIYETTNDTSQLAVESLQLIHDYSKPGVVRVIERVDVSNLGDRVVVPTTEGEPVLHFLLPLEASNLAFDEGALGDRYVAGEQGFGDLRGVLPGQSSYSLLFAYELPYAGRISYDLPIDLPTKGVLALIPEGELDIQSPDFVEIGVQPVEGVTYRVYAADAGYLAGEQVNLTISGPHPLGSNFLGGLLSDESLLAGLAALTLTVGVIWVWVRGGTRPAAEVLLGKIAKLDALHDMESISSRAYKSRRARLKAELRKTLRRVE